MDQKMTNRQARALETRKKIVNAARKMISSKGFENISIEDIVKEAGVSTGTFYTYFRKKEDVVEELNKSDFYRLAEIVNGMEGKSLIERLKHYCREFLFTIEDTGIEICRQWVRNNISPANMQFGDEETTKYNHDYRAMQSVLSEAVRRKELGSDAPVEELSLFINAELYGLMIAWCMSDGEVIGSEMTDRLCDTIIQEALKPYQNEQRRIPKNGKC